jgi:hypothetical protein
MTQVSLELQLLIAVTFQRSPAKRIALQVK